MTTHLGHRCQCNMGLHLGYLIPATPTFMRLNQTQKYILSRDSLRKALPPSSKTQIYKPHSHWPFELLGVEITPIILKAEISHATTHNLSASGPRNSSGEDLHYYDMSRTPSTRGIVTKCGPRTFPEADPTVSLLGVLTQGF